MPLSNTTKRRIAFFKRQVDKIDLFLQKKTVRRINFALVLVVSFLGIYILNVLHPLFGDDWMYSLMEGTSTRHVESLADILKIQYAHYFNWGGRTVVHIIGQLLLLVGIPWGDFINSLAYVSLVLVIYYIANKSNKLNPSLLIVINLLLWFFQPAFGSTMLWIIGSANYLWGCLIILIFLIPYRNQVEKDDHKDSYIKSILLCLGGIIAGWTNENMSVALIFMILFFLIYYKQKTGSVPQWAIWGLVGAVIGCGIMIAAPGNFVRYEYSLAQTNTQGSAIAIFLKRFMSAFASFYYYALPLAFVFALRLYMFQTYAQKDKVKINFVSILFFAGAVVATLAMVASPIFPGRAAFGLNCFIIVAIATLYANFSQEHKLMKRMSRLIITFALLFFVADYYRAYAELRSADKILKERIIKVEKEKKEGATDIVFDNPIESHSRFFHYFELPEDTADWHNRTFSRYYDLHSVKTLKK